jgi:hypothetical protein
MGWLVRMFSVAMLFAALPSSGDTWSPATRTSYLSPDKGTRFTVVPRELKDRLSYFSDKVDGKHAAGQQPGGTPQALGILERRSGNAWTKIWQVPLVNDVAPVSALVANGGGHVVTFDNWHSVGFGDDVVVIYRGDGSLVRSLKLTDILPEDYVRALPTSVSSKWWGGEHVLSRDRQQVVLKVVVPSADNPAGPPPRGYIDARIDLATGAVMPLKGPAWTRAMAAAAPIAARLKAGEADTRARLIAPLDAPTSAETDEWDRYMYQAVRRLAPEEAHAGFDVAWVLPASDTPEYAEKAKDIREIFTEWDDKSDLAFASPKAPAGLAQLLINSARAAPAGRLAGSRLFIALPPAAATGVGDALGRTGATVIVFDPYVPIPQRVENLRAIGVAPEQAAAEVARSAAAARQFEADAVRLDKLAPPEPKVVTKDTDEMEVMADRLEAEADKAEAIAGGPPE